MNRNIRMQRLIVSNNRTQLVIPTSKYSKTPRLIVDLSSPHDNEHVSVNSMINKEDCSYQKCMLR